MLKAGAKVSREKALDSPVEPEHDRIKEPGMTE
jgi:hypothetical protein